MSDDTTDPDWDRDECRECGTELEGQDVVVCTPCWFAELDGDERKALAEGYALD